MLYRKFVNRFATCVFACCMFCVSSYATTISLLTDQYGGLFADGELKNKVTDQLYYVGYTTPSGSSMRAPERRNFFVFDFSLVTPGLGTISSADISLSLPTPGSIFYGDDDGPGPGPKDTTEEFVMSFDPLIDPSILGLDTDPGTNPGGPLAAAADKGFAASIFPGFGDESMAVVDPYLFADFAPPGTPGTGTFNPATEPGEVVMSFNPFGLAVLNAAYAAGEAIVLTGKMLTWSESLEETSPGSGDFLEGSEGIFYHTLKDVDPVETPFLDLTFVVPEPTAAILFAVGSMCLLGRRRNYL